MTTRRGCTAPTTWARSRRVSACRRVPSKTPSRPSTRTPRPGPIPSSAVARIPTAGGSAIPTPPIPTSRRSTRRRSTRSRCSPDVWARRAGRAPIATDASSAMTAHRCRGCSRPGTPPRTRSASDRRAVGAPSVPRWCSGPAPGRRPHHERTSERAGSMTSESVDRQTRPGVPSSLQQVYDLDTRPAPDLLRAETHPDYGLSGVARDRYLSYEFHRLEVEHVWSRTWQMACREEHIPDVGSHVVYDVGDLSLIVIRGHDGLIRAFHNSCLHRGTQLRAEGGRVERLRCPFHGFTWELDGTMCELPCAWDFPHVDPEANRLPQAQVDTWGGFVFVNPDPDAVPLAEYLGVLPEHFERFPLEERWMSAHVAKVLACNWKVG